MSLPSKSKKARTKPPKNRPAATSAVSQSTVENSPSLYTLSAFSPNADLFAYVSLAVDKHRLRVYNAVSGQHIGEHIVASSRVTALSWISSDAEEDGHRKKRKRRKQQENSSATKLPTQTVAVGLSDGTVLVYSPAHAKVIKHLSHPTSTASILAIVRSDEANLWTSGSDGFLRLWSLHTSLMVTSWKSDERIPYSALAIRPSPSEDEDTQPELIAANYSINLLSIQSEPEETSTTDSFKPRKIASFTGHASSVKSLAWDCPSRFLSSAEGDRFVYLWEVPELSDDSNLSEGKVIASISLDSDVRTVSLSSPSSSTSPSSQTLLALSASGKISILPIPSEATLASSAKAKNNVSTLRPRTIVSLSSKSQDSQGPRIVSGSFIAGEEGKIRVAGLAAGIRVFFEDVNYLDTKKNFISEVSVESNPSGLSLLADSDIQGAPVKWYAETPTVAVRSGVELGHDASLDDVQNRDLDGELDVNMAELSLGQRLTVLTGQDEAVHASSSDDDSPGKDALKERTASEPVPATSLTRTLIQALHSSDANLLETCLAHSNAMLIQNTVRRLPPQLAVPLITACVERLGRGKAVGRGKGGGAGASAQRGTGLVRWVRAALIAHGGHLLTMPDLVARLSGLHATLSTRLSLQENLLSLSGRLDMVISQIEMRSSAAPAPLTLPKKSRKNKKGKEKAKETPRYVEGESSEDEGQADGMDVEIESDDDVGSVEDIELGGSDEDEEDTSVDSEDDEDSSEEEDDDDDDEDEDEEDSEGGGAKLNGFIDDEAEEFSGEEDEESD